MQRVIKTIEGKRFVQRTDTDADLIWTRSKPEHLRADLWPDNYCPQRRIRPTPNTATFVVPGQFRLFLLCSLNQFSPTSFCLNAQTNQMVTHGLFGRFDLADRKKTSGDSSYFIWMRRWSEIEVLVYFNGDSNASFYCILCSRWKILSDRSGPQTLSRRVILNAYRRNTKNFKPLKAREIALNLLFTFSTTKGRLSAHQWQRQIAELKKITKIYSLFDFFFSFFQVL